MVSAGIFLQAQGRVCKDLSTTKRAYLIAKDVVAIWTMLSFLSVTEKRMATSTGSSRTHGLLIGVKMATSASQLPKAEESAVFRTTHTTLKSTCDTIDNRPNTSEVQDKSFIPKCSIYLI